MSVRLSLIVLTGLALAACDGKSPRPGSAAGIDCGQCRTAAPATPAVVTRISDDRRAVHPTRSARRETRNSTGYRYERSDESRYGARGQVYSGVSVEAAQAASERYSYSQSSGGYVAGTVSGGGYAGQGGGQYGGAPHVHGPHCGHRLAGIDENGYLTWPGKVED